MEEATPAEVNYLLDKLAKADPSNPRLQLEKGWVACSDARYMNMLVGLAKELKRQNDRVYEAHQTSKRNRRTILSLFPFDRVRKDDLDEWIERWRRSAMGHSFKHTMLSGPEFEHLLRVPKDMMVRALIERLRTDYWMGYQGFLQDLTGADIGDWVEVAPGWRGYNVEASAKAWVRWAEANGVLKEQEEEQQ
ncbi:MAG: hypothetical protein HC888_00010 [Candidatus Competibacteraceae bacterium]|nr:hypothetical protein [Candidatus Competibacteraceae bacterium]